MVLAESAQGLPVLGGPGVAAFRDRPIPRIRLGPVGHRGLLRAGVDRVAEVLLDRVLDRVDEAPGDH